MVAHQALRILQYNVQKSRDVVLASLFKNRCVTEYDIVAIQEPWRNHFINTSYHPLKTHFHLMYFDNPSTRVCFYINKRIDPCTWCVSYTSADIISLTIQSPNSSQPIQVWNVYNEVGTDTLSLLASALSKQDRNIEVILLGDFNLHHPLWSATHRRGVARARADELLTIIEDFNLQLLTVPGTITHRWKDGASTIDLTFATEELSSRVIHCKVAHRLDCDSDHLPIDIAIDWDFHPAIPTRKRIWIETDLFVLHKTVRDRLPNDGEVGEPRSNNDIDSYVASLVEALQAGIDELTPWANPSPRSVQGFDKKCKELCKEVQRLRRTWQRTRHEEDYKAY